MLPQKSITIFILTRNAFIVAFLMGILLVATQAPCLAQDPDPTEPPEGVVSGEGTQFVVTLGDSVEFSVSSTLSVTMMVVAMDRSGIELTVQPLAEGGITEIFIDGLPPLTTLHRYDEGLIEHEVITTDAAGSYQFSLDLSALHLVSIQATESTIYLRNSGWSVPIGTWDPVTRTAVMTDDCRYQTLVIQGDGITLDGDYHIIYGGSYRGLQISSSSNITVKNCGYVNAYSYASYIYNSSNITLTNNCIGAWRYGLYVNNSSNLDVRDNRIGAVDYGLRLYRTNTSTFVNNTISSNRGRWPSVTSSSGNVFSYPKPTGGNHWPNVWTSPDADGDGFVDHPFTFGGQTDYFPFVNPFPRYRIAPTAGPGGRLSPYYTVWPAPGETVTHSIIPNAGYAVQDVVVDGVSQGPVTTYTFYDIQDLHTIAATFVPLPGALVVHFDASDLNLADGQVVDTWGSQTSAGTPTFRKNQTPSGGPAVEFNGNGDRFADNLLVASAGAQDWIVAAVVRPDNIGLYHNLVDDDAENRPMLWIDPAYRYELNFSGGGGARAAGTGIGGWDVVIADSRNNQLYVNSPTPNASGRAPIAFAIPEYFDFFHRDGGQTFSGLVAELRLYNDAAVFASDFASLYSELYDKWIAPKVPPVPDVDPLPDLVGECSVTIATPPTATDNQGNLRHGETSEPLPLTYTNQGTHIVHWTYTDAAGNSATQDQNVIVQDNTPPLISHADIETWSDTDDCTKTVTFTPEVTDNCDGVSFLPTEGTYNLGTTFVTLTATDAAEHTSTYEFTVTVTNPDPVANITGPASGSIYAAGTTVNFDGSFSDDNGGTHEAQWTIHGADADVPLTGTVDEGAGTVVGSHPFDAAGVYLLELIVTDLCGGSGTATTVDGLDAMIVVYDPTAGFVTGGGWFHSPEEAYPSDPTLVGKANFGFVSKYKKGATTPTGQTEFRFKVAALNFHSTSYDWLVIAGARAQYKGAGEINGAGNYGFMLTAIDGEINGGGGADKFRMKIVDKDQDDVVVYDNQIEADINGDPVTTLGGGSIVIHKTGGGGPGAVSQQNDETTLPKAFALRQNHPNPFNPTTTISYDLPEANRVSLRVYDVSGRMVRVLRDGVVEEAGRRQAVWDGRDESGRMVSSGVYFYRLEAGPYSETKRMVLLK